MDEETTPDSVDELPLGPDGERRKLLLLAVPAMAIVAVIALVLALSGGDDEENVASDATTTSTSLTTTSSTTTTVAITTTVVEVTTTAAPATTRPVATPAPAPADPITFSRPTVAPEDIGGGMCLYVITSTYITSPAGGSFTPGESSQWSLTGPNATFISATLSLPYDEPIGPNLAKSVPGVVTLPGQGALAAATYPVPAPPETLC